jgi:hypothetical protein
MGTAPRRAVSPDGRVWRVEKIRERPSLAESRKEPYFWASLVTAVLLLAFFARIVTIGVQWGLTLYTLAVILPALLIWLIERTTNLMRPHIRATTDGPRAEIVEWKSTHPFGTARLMTRAVAAIESGHHDTEPRGLDLVVLEYR